MDGIIKIKVSELNAVLIEHIKALFQGREDAEITITFDDNKLNYYEKLSRSKEDLENDHNLVSFTMEELVTYSKNKKA